jgi:hypothetical protein
MAMVPGHARGQPSSPGAAARRQRWILLAPGLCR